jgi:opacity protein-like surface antigen
MDRRMRAALLAALVALVAAASPAAAANNIVLPRSGQVGLGIQGQFGTMMSSGGLGEEFGSGGGLTVKVRYRMRFERAIGLTFGMQKLGARDPSGRAGAFDSIEVVPGTTPILREWMQLNTAGFEFYQLFDTRERTVKFISAGVGLTQMSSHLSSGETQYPIAGDGVYVSLGAGIERFFYRSMAWDLGLTYMGILHDQKLNNDFQLQGGIIFYAAY